MLNCTRYYAAAGNTVASRTASGLTWLANEHHGTAQVSIAAATLAVMTRRSMLFRESRDTAPPWVNDKGFGGGTVGPTGLTHLGAREYDPTVGRFLSDDPITDTGNPQQMHGYAYANNTPVTASDPGGLKPCSEGDDCRGNTYKMYGVPQPTVRRNPGFASLTDAGKRERKEDDRYGPIDLCRSGPQLAGVCPGSVQHDLGHFMTVSFLDFINDESALAGIDPRLLSVLVREKAVTVTAGSNGTCWGGLTQSGWPT